MFKNNVEQRFFIVVLLVAPNRMFNNNMRIRREV